MNAPWNSIEDQLKQAIEAELSDATAEVADNGGHFQIRVTSPVFEGKRTLEKQRLVYSAIKEFMAGTNAPVHAVDRLETLVP